MKVIFVEQFFVLINPVWDLSPVNNNIYIHTSLTVSSIIMPGWVEASKNNLASVTLQSTKKFKKF